MLFTPVKYSEPVFRPPAEGYSAIVQVTLGCSWNKCAFCEMYSSKTFRMRPFREVQIDIETLAGSLEGVKKVFLADGNAFMLSANHLIPILETVNLHFGRLQRISSYALPEDILSKTPEQLKLLRDLGLKLLYVGIESGDDELLNLVNKGETSQSTREGLLKAHEAGIETSVMILNGLGGRKFSEQHAINSAKLINEIQPRFLSVLTLSLPFGLQHYQQKFKGEYIQQTILELAKELRLFLNSTELEGTIFRSDHVSNNLVLKGTLPKDKEFLLKYLDEVTDTMDDKMFPATPSVL